MGARLKRKFKVCCGKQLVRLKNVLVMVELMAVVCQVVHN